MQLALSTFACAEAAPAEPARFDRAALRWHARFCAEARVGEFGEAAAVLWLLAALPTGRGATAARSLAELCDRRELHPLATVLLGWAEGASR